MADGPAGELTPAEWRAAEATDALVDAAVTSCAARLADAQGSLDLDYCDGSADCPEGHACCMEEVDYGRTVSMCRRLRPGGGMPCAGFERCDAGGGCATRDTSCDHGKCSVTKRSVPCGQTACSAPQPVCCSDGRTGSCRAAGACSAPYPALGVATVRPLECTRRADCPEGAHCCVQFDATGVVQGAECRGICFHGELQGFACATASDCPPMFHSPLCVPEPGFFLASCTST